MVSFPQKTNFICQRMKHVVQGHLLGNSLQIGRPRNQLTTMSQAYSTIFQQHYNKNTKISDCHFPSKLTYRNSSNGPNLKPKGFVIYIKNPLYWFYNKWYIYKVKRQYDPDFNVKDFMKGAKQAVCTVTSLLSTEQFDQLDDMVTPQVLQWLRQKTLSLDEEHKHAFGLNLSDILISRMRGLKLVDTEEEKILYIDTLCIGLKPGETGDEKPFLITVGLRFKKDFNTIPASDWIICGASECKVQRVTKLKSSDDL